MSATQLVFDIIGNSKSAVGALNKVGDETNKITGKMKSSFKSLAGLATGAIVGGGMMDFLSGSMDEARESQKVNAQTAAVLKSTGKAAGVTAGQVGDLATQISNYAGIDDEAIQSGENMLLTFKGIHNEAGKGNDVFNQATKIMTDMSVATGTDMKSAAIQLGKALNDPAAQLSALSRVGITFNAQQTKQIKTMQKSGDVLGAQKVVLAELSKEFGGSAAAQATDADKMSVAFGNFKEQIGTALIPVMDKLERFLTQKIIPASSGVVKWVQNNIGLIKTLAMVLAPLLAAWGVYASVTKIAAATQALLNAVMEANPIVLVVTLLAALVAAFVIAYNKSETFRAIVQAAFHAVKVAAKAVADFFVKDIPAAWNTVIGALRTAWNKVFAFIKTWGPVALAVIAPFIGIPLLIFQHFDKIKGWLASVWRSVIGGIKSFIGDAVGWIANLPARIGRLAGGMLSAGKSLIRSLFNGISNALGSAGQFAVNLGKDIVNGIVDVLNRALHLPLRLPKVHIWGVGDIGGQQLLGRIPRLALGGLVQGPGTFVLGDNPGGQELALPMESPRTIRLLADSMRQAMPAMPTSAPVIVNVNVEGSVLAQNDLVGVLESAVARGVKLNISRGVV